MSDIAELPLRDKDGVPIQIGEMVSSRHRTGRQFGNVVDIVVTEEEAKKKGVAHPPKVLFKTQTGKMVQHNPNVLVHGGNPWEEGSESKAKEQD
ncbi:hypothetical protein D9756_009444 [Leucocoprinus leucothites]|uniref:Hypervirulence associated protein TUDOR domain-containing protein n=1 Tax=Leucocoprinus leucothites TaxID=201217 RepID=A0A8H5FU42_9AGAR|nr:hypothetical protein D9756_009444 [Leucoagaricus leucothites]